MENKKICMEICCGGYEDAKTAAEGGADRIELNSALFLGGLTPSLAGLCRIKKEWNIPVITMVRPRGGGFCYSEAEYEILYRDAELLLEHGADGIAFGFLKEDGTLWTERMERFTHLAHSGAREAVCHRAVDCTPDLFYSFETLCDIGVDRVLTSGGQQDAIKGKDKIRALQEKFGKAIQVLPGSGLRAENVPEFVRDTNVSQIHSSCKGFQTDSTGVTKELSFAYGENGHEREYESVSMDKVRQLREALHLL